MKNLHECLHDAAFDEIMYDSAADYEEGIPRPAVSRPFACQSFALDRHLKVQLDSICRANNTTASAFLRRCCRQMISEYEGIEIGSKKWIALYGTSGVDRA